MSYEKNVFINCPYDRNYNDLLRKMIFTITFLGYKVQIVSGNQNSGELRINKILELVKLSKFSIHDISRNQASRRNDFFRLNMAFELGIDFGCKSLHDDHRSKKFLILDKEKYVYQKSLSDMSGFDITHHNNDPFKLIEIVRNWFVNEENLQQVPSPHQIWNQFNSEFTSYFHENKSALGYSIDDIYSLPTREYISTIEDWIANV
jgi:hypothetical protein